MEIIKAITNILKTIIITNMIKMVKVTANILKKLISINILVIRKRIM